MAEEHGFQRIGDHRDIPLTLGLVVIAWNSCELGMRGLIRTLATRQAVENWGLVEILISELGTLGLEQAIRCYANEFPDEEEDFARALRHVAECAERHKAYRNYYVHGIRGVTGRGWFVSDEMIENDTPIHEALVEGPFGNIYQKSAKGRTRFIMDFIRADALTKLNNDLADLGDYIQGVTTSAAHYLRGADYRQTAPLPEPPPLPSVLVKPELRHPKLKLRRALDIRTSPGGDGEE
jgi:hypothetical protein